MEQQQKMNLNVDLQNTQVVETEEGNVVFQQGVILRRVSKFVVGADEDAVMPIPVFYDAETQKIVGLTLPPDLREEYKEDII